MAPLLDHDIKVQRAKGHLDNLHQAIQRFIENEAHDTITELDPKTRQYVVRLNSDPPEVPPGISPIVGDVLFNLRSGLDHMVYALAMRTNPTCDGEETEFPIYCDAAKFKAGAKRRIGDLPPDAQSEIERMQPYHTASNPRRTYLWALHELNRIDKHRLLHVVHLTVHGSDFVWKSADGGAISVRTAEAPAGGFVKGAEIGRYSLSDGASPDDVNKYLRLASDIRFGPGIHFPEAQNESVMGLLREIVQHVERVCGVFNRFFP